MKALIEIFKSLNFLIFKLQRHVHRHIELTAVLTEMLKQQKRVRESEDFE